MSSANARTDDKDVRRTSRLPSYLWKISYSRISWSYLRKKGDRAPTPAPIHPRPPQYHDLLLRTRWRPVAKESPPPSDVDLNPALVGVRGAEDAIRVYETDVGMFIDKGEVQIEGKALQLFDGELDESESTMSQKRWDDQVESLLGGVLPSHPTLSLRKGVLDKNAPLWDLNALDSPSELSSVPRASPDLLDLTDSELSVDSDPLPSTPKATKKSYADAVFSDGRDSVSPGKDQLFSPLPSKPLDASALSFIPHLPSSADSSPLHDLITPSTPSRSFSPPHFSSPNYEFEFPSLNSKLPPSSASRSGSHSLPPMLQKDEDGFYNQVDMPPVVASHSHAHARHRRPSAAFLPAFLSEGSSPQRVRNSSKTREIVDRLRSSGPRDRPSKGRNLDLANHRNSLSTLEDAVESSESAPGKSSASTSKADILCDADGWITGVVQDDALRQDSSATEDGWITGVSGTSPSAHTRSASNSSLPSSSAVGPFSPATSTFSVPCSPAGSQASTFYTSQVPYPPFGNVLAPANPAMAAYMQMKYQMQAQAQAQWQIRMPIASTAVTYGPALGAYPPYAPYAVAPKALSPFPLQSAPMLYEAHGKGSSMHVH